MARLHRRRRCGQLIVCGIALLCYFVVMSRIGLSSLTVIVPDTYPYGSTRENIDLSPEKNSSLSIRETASRLRSEYLALNGRYVRNDKTETRPDGSVRFSPNHRINDQLPVAELPRFCSDKGFDKKHVMDYPKSTVIVSLIKIFDSGEALLLLSKILRHTSEEFTDDVIITADDAMAAKDKDVLETTLEDCLTCRLFFMKGTIHQHRNAAARFARSSILVFVDAKVEPSEFWLEPLIFHLTFNPISVVSPHLRLRKISSRVLSEGFARIGMTWDMEAIRIPVTSQQNRMLQKQGAFSVNQTSILKEVFAIRKDYFIELGLFDIFPPSSGGEHTSFSLKVINCGGEILTSFCSQVILDIPETDMAKKNYDNRYYYPRDYDSLTFHVEEQNLTAYYDRNSLVWLDAYSSNIFKSSIHRQHTIPEVEISRNQDVSTPRTMHRKDRYYHSSHRESGNNHRGHSVFLKGKMKSMECETTNYRYIVAQYQPMMGFLDRKSQQHGYIRSLDGFYALGIKTYSLTPSELLEELNIATRSRSSTSGDKRNSRWPALVLSRNSSQWVGPFSYNQGMLQYNRVWCIAVGGRRDGDVGGDGDYNNYYSENMLILEPCRLGSPSQLFIFKDTVLRWGGRGGKLCATGNGDVKGEKEYEVSRDLELTPCVDLERRALKGESGSELDFLKIDLEFIEKL